MCDQETCIDADEDLSSLASIYRFCAGSWWSACQACNSDGMNASLDAIREIVVTQTCELSQLFLQLSRQLESRESMVSKMLMDVLVHLDSVEQEDVLEWPETSKKRQAPQLLSHISLPMISPEAIHLRAKSLLMQKSRR